MTLAATLLLAPLAAHAQSAPPAPSHAAPHAATAPAVTAAPEAFPGDAVADEGMWFDDDALAFGLGDEFYLDAGDLDGGDAPMAMEAAPGPDGGDGMMMPGHPHGPEGMGMGMRRGYLSGRPMMHRRMPMLMHLKLAQLDLTEAQRTKLRDLHEASARKAVQRRADMQLARMDLRKLMRADKPDAGAVNSQIDKLARMQAEGMKSAYEVRMQFRATLTPEQLKKLNAPMDPTMMKHGHDGHAGRQPEALILHDSPSQTTHRGRGSNPAASRLVRARRSEARMRNAASAAEASVRGSNRIAPHRAPPPTATLQHHDVSAGAARGLGHRPQRAAKSQRRRGSLHPTQHGWRASSSPSRCPGRGERGERCGANAPRRGNGPATPSACAGRGGRCACAGSSRPLWRSSGSPCSLGRQRVSAT